MKLWSYRRECAMSPIHNNFNGLNGATGECLFPPLTPLEISTIARGEPLDPKHIQELKQWWQRLSQPDFAPKEGVDPINLAESGWAVIFAHDADPAIREALRPLLDLRGEQAMLKNNSYPYPPGKAGSLPAPPHTQFLPP